MPKTRIPNSIIYIFDIFLNSLYFPLSICVMDHGTHAEFIEVIKIETTMALEYATEYKPTALLPTKEWIIILSLELSTYPASK